MKHFAILFLVVLAACSAPEKDLLQYVNITSGTGTFTQSRGFDVTAHGQTLPAVAPPFAMTQWTPQIQQTENKGIAPFYIGRTMLQGFRGTHWLNGSRSSDYGSFTIFPTRLEKRFSFDPYQRQTMYLFKSENASPAYSSYLFAEHNIMTEITATKRCGFFRFSWLEEKAPTVMIDINNNYGKGYIKIDPEKQEIIGYNPVFEIADGDTIPKGFSGYFVAKFDQKIVKNGTWGDFDYDHQSTERKDQKQMGAYVTFEVANNAPVKMKVGTSFTSIENARKNLEAEIPNWDFDATRQKLEHDWNKMLGRIEVKSENTNQLTKFYTALYQSLQQPRLYSDVSGDYPAFSKSYEIKNTQKHNYYGDFATWDTYRAQMPLLSLIAPEEYSAMVNSLLLMAEDGEWLPTLPLQNNFAKTQAGNHSTTIITDAIMKGFPVDAEKAYAFMRKNALTIPSKEELAAGKGLFALETYLHTDFIPLADKDVEAITSRSNASLTLEYAYNDWCLQKLAEKLGKTEDAALFKSRAGNYINIFDGSIEKRDGWLTNGEVIESQLPYNAYYHFNVPHDIQGLMNILESEAEFTKTLNGIFSNNDYEHSLSSAQHMPYLFNYSGEWQQTQKMVKLIMAKNYRNDPAGLCGNNNAGQLSAWYVFSAMGFYPVCPGSNEYQLSSPVFSEIKLHLDKEYYPKGIFTIKADGAGPQRIFKQATINSKKDITSISHDALLSGEVLKFSDQ